jgi:NAD(P)-dependent dehydrogenase (short-subunit alcohol dehydrogenase family)
LERQGAEVFSDTCDVTSKEEVESFIEKVINHWGTIDVLVNNAGVIQVGPMDCMTEDDYRIAMDTHYWGPFFAINAALPAMRLAGGGRIVNISSIGGKVSVPHLLPYSAGKFALAGYSEGLATELEQSNIFVTTVYPGLMRTGSPRNALFKGQHRKEYAWFSISDSLPLLSVNSARAARQIVEACRRGDSQLEISLACKAAVRISAVFPSLATKLLRLVNYWLPRPGGIGFKSKRGQASTSPLSPSVLTQLTENAAERNNELTPTSASVRESAR